ncbi:MAG: hypothetical protein WDW36_008479 [Sanguina aurantia]
MITFALSLLLVFKTNSSFARWWEGRVVWGQIVNYARNYCRMVLMWFPPDPVLRAAALRWASAGPRAEGPHQGGHRAGARGAGDPAAGRALVKRSSGPSIKVQALLRWPNAPQGCGHMLAALVVAAKLSPMREAMLMEQVSLFVNMSGACERIFKTPIPSAYTRHTSRFLLIYLTMVPFLLWPSAKWFTPLVSVIIAFLLLGTENIGVQLEEPFKVLALDAACNGIIANIKDMQQLHEATMALVSQTCTEAGLADSTQHGGRRETLQSNSATMFLKTSSAGYEPGADAFDPRSFVRVVTGASQ